MGEREELDRECRNLRENVDECTLTRVDLERKLLTLREELEFENMVHSEVVNELKLRVKIIFLLVADFHFLIGCCFCIFFI